MLFSRNGDTVIVPVVWLTGSDDIARVQDFIAHYHAWP